MAPLCTSIVGWLVGTALVTAVEARRPSVLQLHKDGPRNPSSGKVDSSSGLVFVDVEDPLSSIDPPYGFGKYRGTMKRRIVSISTSESTDNFKLFRQGAVEAHRACSSHPCSYKFTKEDDGRWWSVVTSAGYRKDFFISASKFEGGRFFTRPALDCSPVDLPRELPPYLGGVAKGSLPFGFAVELEYASRPPPEASSTEYDISGDTKNDVSLMSRVFEGNRSLYFNPVHPFDLPEYYKELHSTLKKCVAFKTDRFLRKGWFFSMEMNAQPVQYKELLQLANLSSRRLSSNTMLDQMVGVCFEIVAPGPHPGVLQGEGDGLLQVYGVMETMRSMGIQAIIRGALQVHINARSTEACRGATDCKLLQSNEVFAIWVLYAQYQRVIDEMLDSRRVQNNYAKGLHLTDENMQRVFRNGHRMLQSDGGGANLDASGLCVALIDDDCDNPLEWNDHKPLRYSALNLAVLTRLKTIEFRQHGATTDTERVMRWAQFCLGFTAAARKALKDGLLDGFLYAKTADVGLQKLTQAQQSATHEGLFQVLNGFVSESSQEFYRKGSWRLDPIEALSEAGEEYLGNDAVSKQLQSKLGANL